MSEWLFDLGNSRLKCAPLQGDGAIGAVVVIDHDGAAFAPGWEQRLPERIDAAFACSVAAPGLALALLDALTRRCGRISIARTQPALAGVRIAYAQPHRLGVDRFLALLAAHARAPQAWLVVGVGTALTIDLLAGDGCHHGGRIAPSPTLMREALHARAPQLPVTGGMYGEFAADTIDALASGCEGAALGVIDRSVAAATALLAEPPRLLLHGGGARALLPQLPHAGHAPALVLEGLARWARA
jgi:type III pantothenate kinase